jgi:DNA-binding LacI/PurR family transcriptional regulator
VLFMSSFDPHTNLLLQDEINHALIGAHLEIEFQPYLFSEGAGFEQLRQLAGKDAHDTVLVTLTQERVPPAIRPEWEKFAARFRARVGFQFEDQQHLPDSVTILSDPLAAARLVADHLLKLGHRRIGVVAGSQEADGSSSERHTAALEEMLTLVGAECFPYQFTVHANKGPAAFAKEHGCTAWWAINDHEALDHLIEFQRAGLRVPQDISLVGSNDTPWAMNAAMPLTTLSLDPPAIAQAIAAAANAVFAGKAEQKGVRRQFIRPVLVARASTVRVGEGQ